jgi:transposase
MYLETHDAGFVCRRCGISRPTLRKWLKRYNDLGEDGLIEQSRKPHNSPNSKQSDQLTSLIKNLRSKNLGARRFTTKIATELADKGHIVAQVAQEGLIPLPHRQLIINLPSSGFNAAYNAYAQPIL